MARLICAGHASCDLPFRPVDKRVFDVDTVFVDPVQALTGGDALNATVGLNKLGMGSQMKFVSVVGDDTWGKLTTDYLVKRDVDISGIIVKPECDSIVTAILIDEHNERHFVFSGNSARNITVEDVVDSFDDDTEYLHIGSFMSLDKLEYENCGRLFKVAKDKGIKTSFDVTFDATGDWLKKLQPGLPYTDTFFASYDEAVCIAGGLTKPEDIARFMRGQGVQNVVLKLGKEGCYATDFTKEVRMPTYLELPVVDTTGAGDSFVAGYLFGTLMGYSMEECCLLGNVNGTLAVGSIGANTGSGTVEQVKDFLRQYGAQTLSAEALIAKLP
ncbi:carbohydrate kinase family protein [Clostridia bacterium OttesenSCG-928-O13]|nr:carbohydrate kinase family protein [Clostridia bacterium OttesenSCG-928-O13]